MVDCSKQKCSAADLQSAVGLATKLCEGFVSRLRVRVRAWGAGADGACAGRQRDPPWAVVDGGGERQRRFVRVCIDHGVGIVDRSVRLLSLALSGAI
jgi:hypothetical protein